MPRITDRLYIGKGDKDGKGGDRELYDSPALEWLLGGRDKKEQFLLAMAFGFKSRERRVLEQREEFFFLRTLGPDDRAILDAVALQTEGALSVLADEEKVLSIAQEYAHAGIRLLADEASVASYGSFEKAFEKELVDVFAALDAEPVSSEEDREDRA